MPSNPFSEGLSVQVSGDTSDATRSLGGLQNSLISTRKAAIGLGAVLAGALAAKGLSTAVSAASEFEDAMVEVEKVTDAETAEELGQSMRELATEIPVAANELAELSADAARFGIRGTENVERFTETVSKMATATDLSTEEAGEAFARLATLTDTPIDQIENFGSAINELGNNFATSSSEIVDSMLRSSAALSQFGLNQRQIAGMSAALNEVSESSQRAGTRLRRVAQELMDPRKVSDLANALGMTEQEFRNLRQSQPDQLMMQMVEAFAEGDETAEQLRGTLSTASRQAVAGLAQNLEGLTEAMETSNRAFEEGNTLQEEFDAATDTFSARVQILKNNLNELAISVGEEILPTLTSFVETLNSLIQGGEDLSTLFGTEIGGDLATAREEFSTLEEPIRDNIEELEELGETLLPIAEELVPKVTPALRDLRFSLELTAGGLEFMNDQVERAIELWNKLSDTQQEAFIEGARQGAMEAALPGPTGTVLENLRQFRRQQNAEERRVVVENRETIRFEGEEDLTRRFAEMANRQLNERERRNDRLGNRSAGG